jgi:type II restriction enzyme
LTAGQLWLIFNIVLTKQFVFMQSTDFIQQITLDFEKSLNTDELKTFSNIDVFLKSYQEKYIEIKSQELVKIGKTPLEAVNSARQSWRPIVGDILVKLIKIGVDKLALELNFEVCEDKNLKSKDISEELFEVKKAILINYGEFVLIPDGDLILYRFDGQNTKVEVLAILSFKTSFRERFTETPYWKLKLSQNKVTENIKVIMVTTDNDDEIAFISKNKQPRKARIVMEYELDGIFIANERFESSDKVHQIHSLFEFLRKICRK